MPPVCTPSIGHIGCYLSVGFYALQFCNFIRNDLSAQLILNYPYHNLGTYTSSEKIMEKKMEEEVNVKRALVTDCAEH